MKVNMGNTAYLLKSLMDNLSDHIYFKDLDSKFILMNEAASRWQRNCPPSEMIGKSDFDVFSHEHAEQAFADEQRIIQTGEPICGKEEKETWPDGSATWVSTTKMPLKNEAFNLSESRLRALFKETAGISLGSHIQNYRLNRAMALLRTTKLPISEIAEEAGFGSPQAFSRIFRKELGHTPQAYRQQR